jgi:pimeloyl-ACP methyl ester carboxylesterase
MRRKTVYRELTAAGILLASGPLHYIARRTGVFEAGRGEPVVLLHGFGGGRSNLLGLAAYLRMAGFTNIAFFGYPPSQSISHSAEQLSEMLEGIAPREGAHLIGHSLGGTIARRFSFDAPAAVRSLITLGSPYRPDQNSPAELAIFGDEDPIVRPPGVVAHPQAFKRMVVLPDTGHLGVLYHPEALSAIESELASNASITI